MKIAVLLALSLSVDALVVCCALGASGVLSKRAIVRVSGSFGFFQGVMPLLGWYSMEKLGHFLSPIDHWIAFFILGFVGLKMFWDALHSEDDGDNEDMAISRSQGWSLLALSVGTSIDALAVGGSFVAMELNPISTSIVIGTVTFLVCLSGFLFFKTVACSNQKWLEMLGGSALIAIGSKILLGHLGFF